MKIIYIEVIRVHNRFKNKDRFYKLICGIKQRISKFEFDCIYDMSIGLHNLYRDDSFTCDRFHVQLVMEYQK